MNLGTPAFPKKPDNDQVWYDIGRRIRKLLDKEANMRKKILTICLSYVVLVALIVVLIPSCAPAGGCTIEVKATFCGLSWNGSVQYTLNGPGATASPITGANVSANFTVRAGNWTCDYVSGGPAGAYLESITPSATQDVSGGGTITFTLKFELEQDAGIDFLHWTVNGDPIESLEHEVVPCQIIDVDFHQWVNGCPESVTAVNETSWLQITQDEGPPGVQLFVLNDWCALNKTPEPPDKVAQVPSFDGDPVERAELLPLEVPVDLDVETSWELVKETDYTKSINWLGISVVEPAEHLCVLFELILPGPGVYQFTLVASAEVELVDDEDINPDNNYAESTPLLLTVSVPP